ncbi:hypothetical protein KV314_004411 [Escherichia coli]|nr:hypothetical protein [Escherichia coli]EEQ7690645.1 hypothetical protein [Escherichia coli]EER7685355.1 hypothetical protein [Escherichia coli]EER9322936.1 hypothetical protein [Escherichia coli]EER9509463.1 hypothetical protein [Escherichia coli]EES2369943.1 hypothetical protein [Escherichia coli]
MINRNAALSGMEGGTLWLNMTMRLIRRSPAPAGTVFYILWNCARAPC